jgi:hypothetical protein
MQGYKQHNKQILFVLHNINNNMINYMINIKNYKWNMNRNYFRSKNYRNRQKR